MRTSEDALSRYVTALERGVACVTAQRLVIRPHISRSGRGHAIAPPIPIALRSIDGGQRGLQLDFRVAVSAIRAGPETGSPWRYTAQMYDYRLLDHDFRELLVYHWQPDSAGRVYPHLHVSASLDAQFDALTRRRIDLDKRHLPTGQVSLPAVVRMLITEFDVRPMRSDWESRLDSADAH